MTTRSNTTGVAQHPTISSATPQQSNSPTYINNLPKDFNLTYEILKNNVCRVCATYCKSEVDLVNVNVIYEGCTLARRIGLVLPNLAIFTDHLSEMACKTCADKIVAWYEMFESVPLVNSILERQARNLRPQPEIQSQGIAIDERLPLSETIRTILASYSVYLESEIVCQLCDTRTTSEEFVRHLETRHATVRGRGALELFIQEHVTFEEALASDPAPDAAPDTREDLRAGSELTEHSSDDARRSAATAEKNQKRIPAVCPLCNRTCSNKYNMLVHMHSHGEGRSATYECACGKSYSTRGNLAAHRRAAHEGVLPHACEACGRGFRTRGARDEHARRHSGARPCVCGECGRAFRGPGALRQHALTHAPRALACALCGRRFRRRAHLRYHVGTHRQPSA